MPAPRAADAASAAVCCCWFFSRPGWRSRHANRLRERLARAGLGITRIPPAKGKRAVHQDPVAADRAVASDHEVSRAELILHLLVALLGKGSPLTLEELQ